MSCEFQRTKAECMQLFVRAARRKFSEILQFFCAILAQRLRDLDAERALFRIGTHFQLGQLQQRFATCAALAGRVHAVFCARGVPEFQKLWNFFARVWQKNCVTSAPDAHLFTSGLTSDSVKRCNDVLRLTQRMLAEFRQFLCARRAKIPGNLQLFRATFALRFA